MITQVFKASKLQEPGLTNQERRCKTGKRSVCLFQIQETGIDYANYPYVGNGAVYFSKQNTLRTNLVKIFILVARRWQTHS